MTNEQHTIMGNVTDKIPLKVNPEINQIYFTGAIGGFTNYDFRIILYNEIARQIGENIETVQLLPEANYELVMSPKTAKELHIWLGNRIKEMEDIMGEEIKTTKDNLDNMKKQDTK